MNKGKALPLSGIRILEFAGIGPAPFAAMLLADMGARILRIDRPGGADPWTDKVVRRNRTSVTADLKSPQDLAQVKALARQADALIEGFRPGVMERLGLGPEVLLAENPALIYGRMTGWGQDGPLAPTAGHDINYIAITGALSAIGPAERPVPPLNLVGDLGGGALYLAMGILAGLLRARQTGQGQVVDCAISDCTISLMAMFSDLAAQGRWDSGRREANILDGAAPFYRTYACRDGHFVAVGALERPFYAALCQGLGLPVLPEAERMDKARWPEQIAAFAAVFLTRTRDEWTAHFAGTDACLAPVLTLEEAPDHPHNRARGAFILANGAIQPAAAPRFSAAPPSDMALPPDHPSLEAALAAWA
ncbi:CaiB/BaiF CoA-transferase family protein [Rhabdaerophilum sp. SD176]|uniref:CaiB/BaiF CoA transferase family protein n=1 Tax=Rhabdaerophilum sp. SD176 TaxID=2983548 RepID=UPI0024DF51BD|nr:CaiB/BaiF CoA-transferase family protein [Rhabdaerophilum sp. SD176]